MLAGVLWAMVAAATCYSAIALYAARRFRMRPRAVTDGFAPPVSLLKPLCGLDRELERNLESFCRQNYPSYEILFSVREERDPAAAVVRRLQQQFPSVPMRLQVTGPPRYRNAKVHGLEEMAKEARHEILVISDSDVRVGREYLRTVVAPLADPAVGMVTCLSRGVPARSIWSLLESLGMNTQYLPGVLTAWLLIGMEFSLGPTMVTRKRQVEEIGGFRAVGDYLADDFVLGERIARAGYRVVLSEEVPDHLFGGETRSESLGHRLRWERSSRCSRPAGYWGQIFTHSLPLALLAWAVTPEWNPLNPLYPLLMALLGVCLVARALLTWQVGWKLLRDDKLRKYWWLLPLEDLLSFGIWCWAFVGDDIEWRGVRLRVLRGGKLAPVAANAEERTPVGAGW